MTAQKHSPTSWQRVSLAALILTVVGLSGIDAQVRRRTVGSWLIPGGQVTLRAESEGRFYLLGESGYNTPIIALTPEAADAWADTAAKLAAASSTVLTGEELELRTPLVGHAPGAGIAFVSRTARGSTSYQLLVTDGPVNSLIARFEGRAAAQEFLRAMRKAGALTRVMTAEPPATREDSAAAFTTIDDCAISASGAPVTIMGDSAAVALSPDYFAALVEQIRHRFDRRSMFDRVEVTFTLKPDGSIGRPKIRKGGWSSYGTAALEAIEGARGPRAGYGPLPAPLAGKEVELRIAFGCARLRCN